MTSPLMQPQSPASDTWHCQQSQQQRAFQPPPPYPNSSKYSLLGPYSLECG